MVVDFDKYFDSGPSGIADNWGCLAKLLNIVAIAIAPAIMGIAVGSFAVGRLGFGFAFKYFGSQYIVQRVVIGGSRTLSNCRTFSTDQSTLCVR